MLRLPHFAAVAPTTLEDLVAALAQPGARLLAGGTDLLPNLKHRLDRPTTLVSIDKVESLRHVTWEDGAVRIGAAVTLAEIAADARIAEVFPSLASAAGAVASPLLRNAGTIGGNINLDTRCRYVNQSEFWRSAIGGCLKSEGDVCHVVPKGQRCVAAMSSDCVPALITLGARLVQLGPEGRREVELVDYFGPDGTAHTKRLPGEITAELCVPIPAEPTRATYVKWTVRKSIDFPLISIAMRFRLEKDSVDAQIREATVCVGALAARPKLVRTTSLVGLALSAPDTSAKLGELVLKQCKPLDNIPYAADYRHKMLPVHARRALAAIIRAG